MCRLLFFFLFFSPSYINTHTKSISNQFRTYSLCKQSNKKTNLSFLCLFVLKTSTSNAFLRRRFHTTIVKVTLSNPVCYRKPLSSVTEGPILRYCWFNTNLTQHLTLSLEYEKCPIQSLVRFARQDNWFKFLLVFGFEPKPGGLWLENENNHSCLHFWTLPIVSCIWKRNPIMGLSVTHQHWTMIFS